MNSTAQKLMACVLELMWLYLIRRGVFYEIGQMEWGQVDQYAHRATPGLPRYLIIVPLLLLHSLLSILSS